MTDAIDNMMKSFNELRELEKPMKMPEKMMVVDMHRNNWEEVFEFNPDCTIKRQYIRQKKIESTSSQN